MRHSDCSMSASYVKEGKSVTVSLYDMSDLDPVEILGEDIFRVFQETQTVTSKRYVDLKKCFYDVSVYYLLKIFQVDSVPT